MHGASKHQLGDILHKSSEGDKEISTQESTFTHRSYRIWRTVWHPSPLTPTQQLSPKIRSHEGKACCRPSVQTNHTAQSPGASSSCWFYRRYYNLHRVSAGPSPVSDTGLHRRYGALLVYSCGHSQKTAERRKTAQARARERSPTRTSGFALSALLAKNSKRCSFCLFVAFIHRTSS